MAFQGSDETTIPPTPPPVAAGSPLWRWALPAACLSLLIGVSVPLARRYGPASVEQRPEPVPEIPTPAPKPPPSVGLGWAERATLEPGNLPIFVDGAEAVEVLLDGEIVARELPYRLEPSLPPGLHRAEVRARSPNGEAVDRRRFRVAEPAARDFVGPQIDVLHPVPPWRTADGRVAIRIRDPSGVSRVAVALNGQPLEPTTDPGGWVRVTALDLAPGTYQLTVTAVDGAGNERRLERRFVVE
jgi:hypothetical protein